MFGILGVLLVALPAANAQGHALTKLGNDATIVPGQPMIEIATETSTTVLSDGSKRTTTTLERKWRDADGRFREETAQVLAGEAPVYETATILDPTKNTVTTLNLEAKLALVFHLPDHGARAFHLQDAKDEKPQKVKQNDQNNFEQLPAKKIAGVDAIGTRLTQTKNVKTAGVETPFVTVTEQWMSADGKMALANSKEDPKGKKTMDVEKVEFKVPDPALFQIPADYSVTDIPMRQVEK